MSGLKCGQIRLEDEVAAAVRATLAVSASATSAAASAAALETELASMVAGAEHFLAADVRKERQAILLAFVDRVMELRSAVTALRTRQDAIEAVRQAEPAMTAATLQQMNALGHDCNDAIRRVAGLSAEIRAQLGEIDAILRSERRGEAFVTELNVRRLRGLLADVDNRLQSSRPGGLRAVREEASRLRADIAASADFGGDEMAFAGYCARLEALGQAATVLEERVFEQRVAHHRLMMAFEQAGYSMAPGSEQIPDDYRSPARSTQVADEEQVRAQTEVHATGELRLTMLGPGGDGPQLITCDDACDSRLQRLIAQAKAHNLRIVNVAPVPGGGFSEDESENTQSTVQARLAQRSV